MGAGGCDSLRLPDHLLASDDARFTDLGADHFTKHLDPDAKKRNHIRQLEALGYTVTLTPAA